MKPRLRLVETPVEQVSKFDPSARGFHVVYHEGERNRCPCCGRSHWIIGRMTAECGFCSTAIPLAEAG